jgi:hypothetical protein
MQSPPITACSSPKTAILHSTCRTTPLPLTQSHTYLHLFPSSNPWATLTPSDESPKDLSPTAELDPLLSHLRSALAFLSLVLAPAPLRRITRAVLGALSSALYDSVLRASFSAQGAAQLNADLEALCAVVDEQVGPGVAASGLRRCIEGAKLVGLPVKGAKSAANSAGRGLEQGVEEWDAWAAEDGGDGDVGGNGGAEVPQKANLPRDEADSDAESGEELGLWEVERRLFADNQSAREVLDQLGLEVLDEKEARRLLRLRVELAG